MTTHTNPIYTTARDVFAHFADLIRIGFVPADSVGDARTQAEGRARNTAATFEQVGQIAGDLPLALVDARAGYERLSLAIAGEPGNVTGRRRTCGQVAALISDGGPGDLSRLAAVFDAVAAHFASTDDPRQQSIRDTARREAAELRAL